MPSTITSYNTFAPAKKARASQVNANFSNHRGDLLPINEDTATASDMTHYLGAPDHYWLGGYHGSVQLKSSTTTAGLILRGAVADTLGAFQFDINSVAVAKIGPSGMDATYLKSHTVQDLQIEDATRTILGTTFNANGTYTVPTGTSQLLCMVMAGGGGGGGGSGGGGGNTGGGGGGGAGCLPQWCTIPVTAGDILSITVGAGGTAGAGVGSGGTGGIGGTGGPSKITRSAVDLFTVNGAAGGAGGTSTNGGNGGGNNGGGTGGTGVGGAGIPFFTLSGQIALGGSGGGGHDGANGAAGVASPYAAGGAAGAGASSAAGGGGGGSAGLGAGGGGNSGSGANNSGAGAGGGRGGTSGAGQNAGIGGSGQVVIYNTK